jgi:hypothetical protein
MSLAITSMTAVAQELGSPPAHKDMKSMRGAGA